jgi:hypothetical protein
MDDDALDIVRAQRRGKAVDLDIAEAVIGEMRLEAFACGIAAQHPAVGGTRGAQIGLIDRAILAQQFGETQGDGVSASPLVLRRTQPAKFCPKSTTTEPSPRGVNVLGRSTIRPAMGCTAAPTSATGGVSTAKAGSQRASGWKAGVDQPG